MGFTIEQEKVRRQVWQAAGLKELTFRQVNFKSFEVPDLFVFLKRVAFTEACACRKPGGARVFTRFSGSCGSARVFSIAFLMLCVAGALPHAHFSNLGGHVRPCDLVRRALQPQFWHLVPGCYRGFHRSAAF